MKSILVVDDEPMIPALIGAALKADGYDLLAAEDAAQGLDILKQRSVDLLIADAQYDDDQYAAKLGWGHSSCFSVTDLAVQAKVKNLALFHHDPESTDREVDAKVKACCQRVAQHRGQLMVFAAREGVELKFRPPA